MKWQQWDGLARAKGLRWAEWVRDLMERERTRVEIDAAIARRGSRADIRAVSGTDIRASSRRER